LAFRAPWIFLISNNASSSIDFFSAILFFLILFI